MTRIDYQIEHIDDTIDSLSRVLRMMAATVTDPEVHALIIKELDRVDGWIGKQSRSITIQAQGASIHVDI